MNIQFEALGCRLINLNNSRLKGALKNKETVRKILAANHIDILHSHGFRADMINAELMGVCRFSTIHNFPAEDYPLQYGKIKGAIMAGKHSRAIARIEHPIACSKYISEKFSSSYNLKVSCINNGIVTSLFQNQVNKTKTELRRALELPLNKKIFLVSGSLIKRKDPETILKAFDQLNDNETILVLIGTGKLENKLKSRFKSDDILFKGAVNNVSDYLYACDFFISSSSSEGLPNSVLEAMYSGLPVILSDIDSHREIVGHAYPFLFKPSSVSELKEKLSLIVKLDNTSLIKSNAALIISDFNAKDMAKQYQKKYLDQCLNSEK
jgi:glycosyltransferase involved in cell wall biosynthesis